MRTYIGALVALYAFGGLPLRNIHCNTPLFKSGCSGRESAVFPIQESTDRKIISLQVVNRIGNVPNKIGHVRIYFLCLRGQLCPCFIYLDLMYFPATINGSKVHIHDFFTFPAVTLNNEFTHFFNSLLVRYYFGYLEESRLHYGISSSTKSDLSCNLCSINSIKLYIIFSEILFHAIGQSLYCLFIIPHSIQEESTAFFQAL